MEKNSPGINRLKTLYPFVDEDDYFLLPLPLCWNSKDKSNYIGLSENNLRVTYQGYGKTQMDAASVRATHPIPSSCGLYYFEVKILDKGNDGYIGVGLSAEWVDTNALPGWRENSFGYHGDDGKAFCSSGVGQPYGPTFTTNDVIGCGINFIDNTCFYTKNGVNLGTAFFDLPLNLYPTIGLNSLGEIVEANFGESPFVYNIEDDMKELRARIASVILNYTVPDKPMEASVQSMIATYLMHHPQWCDVPRSASSASSSSGLNSSDSSCSDVISLTPSLSASNATQFWFNLNSFQVSKDSKRKRKSDDA
ncbi:ran-binding protein 10-like isoform X1 [Daphnia carinata]|uniref:ran-binding protein 10-like isoform X1 n=2 Tax=Daphnia carinata TaxID=120202 RepID=UPI00257BBFC1|nr:ran-binding protein 10-like isoform X1 [Daphnia carinata]